MDDTQVNIPLLRKAVEWAEVEAAKPAELCEWFQGHYWLNAADELDLEIRASLGKAPECGTCYCIAGFVAAQSSEAEKDRVHAMAYADQIGQRDLGLSDSQAYALFSASNSIEDVRRIAEDIAGERL